MHFGTSIATPTVLHAEHERLGARMVEFAGRVMPVRYGGIFEEHAAVRGAAGLFDLSHMGQFELRGEGADALLENLGTNRMTDMPVGRARYTVLTRDDGGALDDVIAYRLADRFLVVANAANARAVHERLLAAHGPAVAVRRREDRALVAVQGPRAASALQPLVDLDLGTLTNYTCGEGRFGEDALLIARTGYTGEDGFELFVAEDAAARLFRALLETGAPYGLRPAGLAARDILRLEAGMPLYGRELSAEITPVQAGLDFAIRFDKPDFPGKAALAAQRERLPSRIAGLRLHERVPARPGYEVLRGGVVAGEIRSATISPSLGGASIATALVRAEDAEIGHTLDVRIRGRLYAAEIVRMPFYKRGDAATRAPAAPPHAID